MDSNHQVKDTISHTYTPITFNKMAIKKFVTFSSNPSALFVEYFQFLF